MSSTLQRLGFVMPRQSSRYTTLVVGGGGTPAPVFSQALPPGGQVGVPYNGGSGYQFIASDTTTYALNTGTLPPGLTITDAANGILGGGQSPSTAGTYTFKINAIGPGGTTSTVDKIVTIDPAGGGSTPLSENVFPNVEAAGYDLNWTNQTIIGSNGGPNASDGLVRMQYFANVLGTGFPGTYRMVRSGDTMLFSGHRAETGDSGSSPVLQRGVDYWVAVNINPYGPRWSSNNGNSADQQILFQDHQLQPGVGDGPCWGLVYYAFNNSLRLDGNYDDGSTSNHSYTIGSTAAGASGMVAGQWSNFIVHFRLGEIAAYNPIIEVYQATNAGTYTLIFSKNFAQGLKLSGPLSNTDYLKMGFYKWSSTQYGGGLDSRAAYYSGMGFGQGVNLLEEAKAFNAGYKV